MRALALLALLGASAGLLSGPTRDGFPSGSYRRPGFTNYDLFAANYRAVGEHGVGHGSYDIYRHAESGLSPHGLRAGGCPFGVAPAVSDLLTTWLQGR